MTNYTSQAQMLFTSGVFWELEDRYVLKSLIYPRRQFKRPSVAYKQRVAAKYWRAILASR